MIGRARTRLALVAGACAWLGGPGTFPTTARAQDRSCKVGTDNAYMVWVDAATSKLTRTEIPKELLKLAAMSPAAPAPAGLTMSTLDCDDPTQIARVRAKMPAFIHGLVDNRVLMAIFASGPDLEYYLFPYLLDGPTLPPKLVRASCGPNHGEPAEIIDAQRRTQAYAYAAAALYEIRQQESRPDACGSRRAEVLVQRALTFVGDAAARVSIPDSAEKSLLEHLKERCLVLELGIERMSRQAVAARPPASNGAAPRTSETCGLPRASQQLAGLALDPNSVCGTSP
jgi:hypothetical protein